VTWRLFESLAIFLIDIAAKGTVLLMLAFFVTWLLRRSSAAMRHAVWSLTMLSLVLLPVAWWALPSLTIPILPRAESPVSSARKRHRYESEGDSALDGGNSECPAGASTS
jgi:hypothetical protein